MKTMRVLILAWALISLIECVYAQEKYAVLITGDYRKDPIVPQPGEWNQGQGRNPDGDFEEFWNDTFLMWELLQSKGYSTDNIFVLFDNGQDYYLNNQWVADRYRPSDPWISVTDFSASKANVIKVFNGLLNGTDGFPRLSGICNAAPNIIEFAIQ